MLEFFEFLGTLELIANPLTWLFIVGGFIGGMTHFADSQLLASPLLCWVVFFLAPPSMGGLTFLAAKPFIKTRPTPALKYFWCGFWLMMGTVLIKFTILFPTL